MCHQFCQGTLHPLCHAGHLLTGLGAAAANFGAFLHLRIVATLFTAFGTARKYFRAHAANPRMRVGFAKHKISARNIDLRTVAQQSQVCRLGVWIAHLRTVSCGLLADAMAVQAVFNALFHFNVHLMTLVLGHGNLLGKLICAP